MDYPAATIRFYAARDIPEGEELTISYGRVWWDEKAGERQPAMPGAPGDTSHDHLDDEDAFLGGIGIGLED